MEKGNPLILFLFFSLLGLLNITKKMGSDSYSIKDFMFALSPLCTHMFFVISYLSISINTWDWMRLYILTELIIYTWGTIAIVYYLGDHNLISKIFYDDNRLKPMTINLIFLIALISYAWCTKRIYRNYVSQYYAPKAKLYPEPYTDNPLKNIFYISIGFIVISVIGLRGRLFGDFEADNFILQGIASAFVFILFYISRFRHAWLVFILSLVPFVIKWIANEHASLYAEEANIAWYIFIGFIALNIFTLGYKLKLEYQYYLSCLYRTSR